jgi:hypothetical protein
VSLKQLLKEPLTHFLLAGCALFIIFEYVGDTRTYDASRRIVVDGDRLLTYLQLGSNPLEPDRSELRLEDLTPEELARLIDDFVREEALYREATALGLDRNDAVFRRQLIRRLESVNQMVVSSGIQVSENDLATFLAEHEERYRLPPTITFTHVYFSVEKHGDAGARALALSMLEELNARHVPFHEAPARGDRFLYNSNYVHKAADEVRSHFGSAMQRELFAREPDAERWIGPFLSPYGYHLVLLTARTGGRTPSLDEVRLRVEADAFQTRVQEEVDRISRAIVESYDVVVDAELKARIKNAGSE